MHWEVNCKPSAIPPFEEDDMAALQVIDIQKALNKAGQKGATGKVLSEDDIYGPNTEFALVNGLKNIAAGGVTAAQLAAHAANPDAHHD
jgi:hypothetical protein